MSSNTPNDALIFIPDISGFTNFVKTTEIQHAKHIVEELMEAILAANEIGLELSEIEGDALLLYRKGKAPTCHELLAQVQKMYVNFHAHLKKYETQRICSCGACLTAHKLELKFVTHYGEISETTINNRPGLFGEAVIVAHRLLKNKVDSDEYSLFSNALLSACPSWPKLSETAWDEVHHLEEEYDFGTVKYSYVELKNLKDQVPEPKLEDFSIPGATQMIFESEGIIEAPIDLTFNVVSDYNFRAEFIVGQLDNDLINHKIFQNGTVHKCIVGNKGGNPIFTTHDYSFDKNKITFVETDKKNGVSVVWTLQAVGKELTRVGITNFIKPNFIKVSLFNLFLKKKFLREMEESWVLLNTYCKSLMLEEKEHPNDIILPEKVKGVA